MKTLRPAICLLLATLPALAQKTFTAAEAQQHIGERATVCGEVASTHYAARSRGNPTFINLDKPYPSEVFTLLIWGADRPKFGEPEETYRNKHICVTGQIGEYKGTPQVVAHDPSQVQIK